MEDTDFLKFTAIIVKAHQAGKAGKPFPTISSKPTNWSASARAQNGYWLTAGRMPEPETLINTARESSGRVILLRHFLMMKVAAFHFKTLASTSLTNCGISKPSLAASFFSRSYCPTASPCHTRSIRRICRMAT